MPLTEKNVTRDIRGKVPWSAFVRFAAHGGYVGMCSASDTVEAAQADARAWLAEHSDFTTRMNWYSAPYSEIEIGGRNAITGERRCH
jgi:hypothetical protein